MHVQINENLTSPSRVSAVRVEGAERTREGFLGFLINPFLGPEKAPGNLEGVLHAARGIAGRLEGTGIFRSVEARIDRARSPVAQEGDVDLVFRTREKGRVYLKTSTELGNNEGSAVCCCSYSHCLPAFAFFLLNMYPLEHNSTRA